MLCTDCGREIIGEPLYCGNEGETVYFDGETETVVAPGLELFFCGSACAWRYGVRTHKAIGMSGKEARRHLIEFHGFKSSD